MKRTIPLLPALVAALGLGQDDRAAAQTFTNLHSFTAENYNAVLGVNTNRDGKWPGGDLLLVGNTLFGPAYNGGGSGNGTVVRVNTDGTGFTNLHNFSATSGPSRSNSDGAHPIPGLISSGDTLFGTTPYGGSRGYGTVFRVNIDGVGFTNLHSFTNGSDGNSPFGGLVLSGSTLYGVSLASRSNSGTVFKINTDGTGFAQLHGFAVASTNASGISTNSDGASPANTLVLCGNTLYGTTGGGGSWGNGTVFALNTNGTGFATLYSFTAGTGTPPDVTNSDGAFPDAPLILSGNTLFGTTVSGGASGNGTVFALKTDGTGFNTLHSFTALSESQPGTNSDGAEPHGRLLLSSNTLYGTAVSGGSLGVGTVFQLNTDGTRFMTLHSFIPKSPSSTTAGAFAGLVLSGNILYGTARYGGSAGNGSVFSLSLPPPQLTITPSGAGVVLTWPTNAAGFTLQSAPAISGTLTNLSGATSPYTNPISGAQQFFRLISN